ncbi:hypothetical protein HYDPIDRAFT_167902 [Hydnomerulius pinastri MD-312]|uniref:Uncharacterized protein n=1 Tax=Hydnomerulius pinastri MD-312 TaxID=994086 RepID=A0A0C9W9X5_9AGAM|nr:hypothetical protein HYDPIDRAFT_167902 [Hydnomerulius pinastri MD-312]
MMEMEKMPLPRRPAARRVAACNPFAAANATKKLVSRYESPRPIRPRVFQDEKNRRGVAELDSSLEAAIDYRSDTPTTQSLAHKQRFKKIRLIPNEAQVNDVGAWTAGIRVGERYESAATLVTRSESCPVTAWRNNITLKADIKIKPVDWLIERLANVGAERTEQLLIRRSGDDSMARPELDTQKRISPDECGKPVICAIEARLA